MVWRVKEAFSYDRDGVPVTLRRGTLLAENDPHVRGHEAYLEPVEKAAARTGMSATETATAGPGEQRSVTTVDETDRLRAQAQAAGVQVDKRWGADRLRQEIDKATEGKE